MNTDMKEELQAEQTPEIKYANPELVIHAMQSAIQELQSSYVVTNLMVKSALISLLDAAQTAVIVDIINSITKENEN